MQTIDNHGNIYNNKCSIDHSGDHIHSNWPILKRILGLTAMATKLLLKDKRKLNQLST